jgi:hypothetical protein
MAGRQYLARVAKITARGNLANKMARTSSGKTLILMKISGIQICVPENSLLEVAAARTTNDDQRVAAFTMKAATCHSDDPPTLIIYLP